MLLLSCNIIAADTATAEFLRTISTRALVAAGSIAHYIRNICDALIAADFNAQYADRPCYSVKQDTVLTQLDFLLVTPTLRTAEMILVVSASQ